ncbi:MAG: hypothetical protein KDC44_05955, partial [Phaeodactylibacter sp.]|nr:hypothetical protein [Phaeodactylibacter sp.]
EMQTGEGKTLTAVLPAYLNALLGKQVCILTFNDYLAQRDAHWMGPVYRFLELEARAVQQGQSIPEKQAAYQASIIYATAKELGFDYLRSAMALEATEALDQRFDMVIVDEADAIMIDEARNPLVLAGQLDQPEVDLYAIAALVAGFQRDTHFEQDARSGNLFLKDPGIQAVLNHFQIPDLESEEQLPIHTAVILALQARCLLRREVDYLVEGERLILIDEFTGRRMPDRKWRNGLQAAVEAKEGLPLRSEGVILNAITLQHLLQKFDKLAGMTATAQAAAEEFEFFYGMSTAVVPTHRPCIREDLPDQLFRTKAEKMEALVQRVREAHQQQRPVLVGTLTVAESEELAARFEAQGLPCHLLNAKNDAAEAPIVAKAGRLGAITIATNMAGRGTDILLGAGDPVEHRQVVDLGGLLVLGTNRHESSRIDRQLRGRAGRQGDPGSAQFFISYEDELMLKYEFEKLLPKKLRRELPAGPIREQRILKYTDIAQRIIEAQLYDRRKSVYEFSNFVEKQRQILAQERLGILQQPASLFAESVPLSPEFSQKAGLLALSLYDQYWARHLDEMTEMRDNIQFVRLGGQKPLWVFRKYADSSFEASCRQLDQQLEAALQNLLAAPESDLSQFGFRKPGSTWTYVLYHNPFENHLSTTLLDNSNIALQLDFLTAPLLFVKGLMERRRRK